MENEKKYSPIPGIILIALGIIIILSNFGALDIDIGSLWIYIVILLGIIFWIGFLVDRSKPDRLMPGTILLTVGILFYYLDREGWHLMSHLWPIFILAPAFGFYAMVFLGRRERGLLVPAAILTIIGLFFILQSFDFELKLTFGIALLLIGILLLFRFFKSKEV